MKKIELKSREHFVQQVADTITKNHTEKDDSFIFGISGKWGEGKTTFMDSLRDVLKKEDFTVIDFNPWKFASDKISFLRSFLSVIKSEISVNKLERLRKWFLGKDDALNLYYDVSKNKINWSLVIIASVLLAIASFIYSKLPLEIRDNIKAFKWSITLFAVPIGFALFTKVISIQKSSRSISTLDNFEKLLREYLCQLSDSKLIVFVDDLDRVTPKVARNVLDNLRTFFDKKELTFVVAGDHTVLERYLGQDLMPRGGESEKLEEGRRFMKKIFNVYWRLPLPIDSELSTFLDNLFKEKSKEFNRLFPKEADRNKLREYMALYFEKNFRHIERFAETILFTFGIIENSKKSADETSKNYFVEMENNPLLVVRILMIQELCAPLFEKTTEDTDFFLGLEYLADKKDNASVNKKIESLGDLLSSSQKNFITKFLFEKPKFFENAILRVSNIRPFLHLAADAGFGDSRGVSADDFALILDKNSPEEVKQALVSGGPEKIKGNADKFIEKVNGVPEANQKINFISTVIKALVDIPQEYKLHQIFLDKILSLNYDFYKQLPPQTRMENYLEFWKWLDKFPKSKKAEAYIEKFNYSNQEDLNPNFIPAEFEFGKTSSAVMMSWLAAYYAGNKPDALTKIKDISPRMEKSVVKNEITKIADDLINDFNNDADINLRNIRYSLVVNYAEEKKNNLKNVALEKIGNMDDGVWSFVMSKIEEKNPIWTKKEAEKSIINKFDSLQDISQFIPLLRFSIGKVEILLDDLWKSIIEKHAGFFIDNILQYIDDNSLQSIAPSDKNAQALFDKVFEKIKGMDSGQRIEYMKSLDRNKWLWAKLKKVNKKKLLLLTKSKNEQVSQSANVVLETWFPKEEKSV